MTEGSRNSTTARGWSAELSWRTALWLAVPLLSTVLILGIAANGFMVLVPVVGIALVAWSIRDIRASYLIGVLLATFVDTSGGHLVVQLALVYGWLAWTALLTFWRSAWKPWVFAPTRVATPILVWLAVCFGGALLGWFTGNDRRILLLEWSGAIWPVIALLVCQVQSRRTLGYAAIGIVLVALAHTVFGLAWLKIAQQRLGGVYFTTVPGFVAVGVWTVVLLAPPGAARRWAFVLLIPFLTHQFFSFTRGYWLGVLAGMAVATWLARRGLAAPSARRTTSVLGLAVGTAAVIVGTLALSVLYFGKKEVLDSAGKRFQSSFSVEASGETGSNIMRLAEYSLAIDGVRSSPIVGKGWGYLITDRDPFTGMRFQQGVIHNYYLFLCLKLGLVGLAAFGFYITRFLRNGIAFGRREQDWLARAWVVAATAMTVQALVICITNYVLNDFCTGIFLAYVWGTALALQARAAAS